MEQKEIEKLLEKYWDCDASREEEQLIRRFFSSEEVPDYLSVYKPYFMWQDTQSDITCDDKIIRQILDKINNVPETKKQRNISNIIYFSLKIAASVLIVLACAIGVYTNHVESKQLEQSISDTYSNPDEAMKEAQAALNKISYTLQRGNTIKENLEADTTNYIDENQQK